MNEEQVQTTEVASKPKVKPKGQADSKMLQEFDNFKDQCQVQWDAISVLQSKVEKQSQLFEDLVAHMSNFNERLKVLEDSASQRKKPHPTYTRIKK